MKLDPARVLTSALLFACSTAMVHADVRGFARVAAFGPLGTVSSKIVDPNAPRPGAANAARFAPTDPLVADPGPQVVESLGDGITRFFASPAAHAAALPSYALVNDGPGQPVAEAAITIRPRFGVIREEGATGGAAGVGGRHAAIIDIDPATSLYGTGQVPGPLLRNGRTTTLWNTDAYGYGDTTQSLYQSHPFVMGLRPDGTAFGIIADSTFRMTIDTAAAHPGQIRFIADGPAFPVIVIEGAGPAEVVAALARLTGTMELPPKWAIGYHQCRFSYYPESRVREIAQGFRDRQIPADVIWMDIDYMAGFRIFTFNREFFPDPARLNADLLAMGFHNVWMINPGIKARDDASSNDPTPEDQARWTPEMRALMEGEWARFRAIRDDGLARNAFVTRPDGTVYQGEVWPSWCFFPDFTDPAVRTWWGGLYKPFIEHGITGVWNDMNEPAIFNVPSKTMPEDNRHRGDPALITPTGQPQGERAADSHARYHNVYGMMMIKATREGIRAARPEHRPFVLSRANFLGGQRYGPTWTGDNTANWYHVEVSVPMILNLGLSGQPFTGPDIGGFINNGDGPMFARWMGFGSLLPFARGHTGKGNVDKEPWSFGPVVEATSREALNRRYRFLPYLYTVFREASVTGLPIARPVFFADPTDPALRTEDDAFLVGADLLVVPQLVPDRSRAPALPRGDWAPVEVSDDPDLPQLFIRPGAIVPQGPLVQFVGQKPLDPLTLFVNLSPDENAMGQLYEDAGDGFGYRQGDFLLTTYTARREGDSVIVRVQATEGSRPRPNRALRVEVFMAGKRFSGEGVDGQPVIIPIQ